MVIIELQELISNLFPFFPLIPGAGFQVSQKEIENIINEADKDGSGTIEVQEFLDVMKEKMLDIDFDEEVIEAFRIFDTEGGDNIPI